MLCTTLSRPRLVTLNGANICGLSFLLNSSFVIIAVVNIFLFFTFLFSRENTKKVGINRGEVVIRKNRPLFTCRRRGNPPICIDCEKLLFYSSNVVSQNLPKLLKPSYPGYKP